MTWKSSDPKGYRHMGRDPGHGHTIRRVAFDRPDDDEPDTPPPMVLTQAEKDRADRYVSAGMREALRTRYAERFQARTGYGASFGNVDLSARQTL